MTFEDLLVSAAEPTLQKLVGAPGLRLLRLMSGDLTQPDRLREVALGLQSPQEMLLSQDSRDELLELLRPDDAGRLAAALGISNGQDPYGALRGLRIRRGSSRAAALLGFFGLVEPEAEPRVTAPALDRIAPAHGLFAHQRKAAGEVLKFLNREPHRVLLHMPTGSGKTRTAMSVIAKILSQREPTLVIWLAHSEELCEQAAEEFATAWAHHGDREVALVRWFGEHELPNELPYDGLVIAGLAKAYASARKSVAEIGTLAGRVSLVVMDEAHQAIAPTYQFVLELLSIAGGRAALLGLTATPGRTWADIDEDQRLSDFFFSRKVGLDIAGFESPVDYLVAEGYLARAGFHELTYSGGVEVTERDRRDLADALEIPDRLVRRLAEHEQRNLVIVTRTEQMVVRHERILIFAATVDHALLLATVLRARGVDASAVTGATPSAERQRIIARYRDDSPSPRVLVNFGVLTAGFDAPRTSGAIIARPTKSLVLYSQMVGRATRGPRAGGNATAEVVTVVDTALPGFSSIAEAFSNWEDVWRPSN